MGTTNGAARHTPWALWLAVPLLAACTEGSGGDDDDQDAASGSDAGGPYCEMVISFSPTSPVAPTTVYVDGTIYREGGVSGVEQYQFAVTYQGEEVPTTDRDPFDGSKIEFEASETGPHRVSLVGQVGSLSCTDGLEIINVTEPGALTVTYRLRFVPLPAQPAPPQERLVAIPGGAAYDVGTMGLDSGVETSGVVHDTGATPLPSYLRLAPVGAEEQAVETFANASGGFSTRLAAGSHDVLVVPDSPTVSPELFTDLGLSALGQLELTAGDAVSGSVLDPGGAPLAGARVALRTDGVPSTIATTDASGAFTLLARTGGATSVHVSPPEDSGLLRLNLPTSAGLVASSSNALTIRYAPGLTSRAVALDLLLSDAATPAPGARATWIARPMANAGTVTPDGGAALAATGGLRLTAVADAGGALSPVVLPETVYDVIVEPLTALTGESVRLAEVSLETGVPTPSSLSLAPAATLTGTVVRSGDVAVQGVNVTAVPRGVLANVAGASATATTSAAGAYFLAVVGAGAYDLVFDAPNGTLASARTSDVVAPAAGSSSAVGSTQLEGAIRVTGDVSIPGVAGGARGVHVMALCHECDGMAARIPVAGAVTDLSGRFTLAIPDPGIAEVRRAERARSARPVRATRSR